MLPRTFLKNSFFLIRCRNIKFEICLSPYIERYNIYRQIRQNTSKYREHTARAQVWASFLTGLFSKSWVASRYEKVTTTFLYLNNNTLYGLKSGWTKWWRSYEIGEKYVKDEEICAILLVHSENPQRTSIFLRSWRGPRGCCAPLLFPAALETSYRWIFISFSFPVVLNWIAILIIEKGCDGRARGNDRIQTL